MRQDGRSSVKIKVNNLNPLSAMEQRALRTAGRTPRIEDPSMWDWLHTHHEELQSLGPVAVIAASIIAACVTTAFACFQLRITRSQRDIAQDKLALDWFALQYDRRAAVYEATRKFLADVFAGGMSEAAIHAYGLRTLDAKFLFHDDPSLHQYLATIRERVAMWLSAKTSAEAEHSRDEKREFERITAEHLNWITQQGTAFDVKFGPFLVQPARSSPKSRSWLCAICGRNREKA